MCIYMTLYILSCSSMKAQFLIQLLLPHICFHFCPSSWCSEQVLGEPGVGGSSTPSMVGAVKKWQKSDPQGSLDTWTKLSEGNSELETQLNTLSKLAAEHWDAYKYIINSCSKLTSEKVFLSPLYSKSIIEVIAIFVKNEKKILL